MVPIRTDISAVFNHWFTGIGHVYLLLLNNGFTVIGHGIYLFVGQIYAHPMRNPDISQFMRVYLIVMYTICPSFPLQ